MSVKEINHENFEEEVLKSEIPVLVDLWAPWCGPCKAINSTVEEIADDFEGKLKVVNVNIDESPIIASNYKVMSIPTLLIFNKGNVEVQIIGLVSKSKIIDKFASLIV
ncbi:MAG: thioredoxin [Candidatus Cloacimonetes bacterium]|nr:thioredoxin [Candidatus Cloacimonadota bacterium]